MGYVKNISSNVVNQVLKIIIGFLVSILIARALGPENQGYISYVLLIFGIIGSYGHFGINNATVYFHKKSQYSEEQIYRTNTSYLLLNFIIISIIVLTLRHYNLFLKEYSQFYIYGGLIFIFCSYLLNNHNLFFLGNENIIESNKYSLQAFFFKSIFIILFFVTHLLNKPSYFVISVLAVFLNMVLLHRKFEHKLSFQINKSLLKEEFKYGLIVYFSSLFVFLHYRVDQIFIKYMKGNAELGVYTIAVTLAELLFIIPTSVTLALTSKLINCQETIKKHIITTQTIKFTFYICLVLCVCGMFGALLIPYIYGIAYKKAIVTTMILLTGIIFASVGRISFPYFFSEGKAFFHLIITFITLSINIILNLVLIPHYSLYGAAFASSISYFIYGLYYVFLFVKREHFTLKEMFYISKEDIQIAKGLVYTRIPRRKNDH